MEEIPWTPMIFRDNEGKEIATLNERVSPVDVYNALNHAYEQGNLSAGMYLGYVEGLNRRGLLHPDQIDWDLCREIENAVCAAVEDGISIDRGHPKRSLAQDLAKLI